MHKPMVCLVASLLVGTAPIADACGDKLVPIGGAVRMERIARTANPGMVYVFATTTDRATQQASADLMAGLARTGHRARLVRSQEELRQASREVAPDVVLAQTFDIPDLQSGEPGIGAAPVLVRVMLRPSRSELDSARRHSGCIASIPDWGVSPVVRVVNEIRAAQVAGRKIECSEHAQTQS
jgi:hypothetical protein